ncbi:MAG: glycosyltransferase family 4 protein [Candidatus Hydrogenedentota bacterium]
MMGRAKHIAMIGYTFYASDERLKRTVRTLRRDGWTVDVITVSNPRGPQEQEAEGVRFYLPRARHFGRQGKLRQLYEYARYTLSAARILLWNHLFKRRYAFVHVNNMPNFLVFAALPLRVFGVPVLLDIHDTMPEIYQDRFGAGPGHWVIRALRFEEWLSMKLADFVLTTEHTKWERLQTNGLSAENSAVTLNLADPTAFPMLDIPEASAGPAPVFRVVYHGTLTRRLGMDIAVRAVSQLRDRVPGIRLDITGDGEQRAELIELTQVLNAEDIIHFSDGFVPGEKLAERLLGADLAVVPSRNNIATSLMLPVKLLEYVALGIPAVTVATPTITRYFNDLQVRFVPPEDPDALADAIEYLYQHPDERRALAVAARDFFEKHSFESQQRTYLDVVHRLTRIDTEAAS